MHSRKMPVIDGEFWVFPDGRRVRRQRGARPDPPDPDPKPGPDDDPKPDPDEDPDPDPDPDDDPKTFDEKYVKKLRAEAAKHRKEARDAQAKVKEFEDAGKSEKEKLEGRASTAEERATAAEATALRLEVALDKAPEGMPLSKIRQLAKRLSGKDKEELEADAEELFADFAPEGDEDDSDDDGKARRPKEKLRPGAAPGAEPEETDPKKLAAQVSRSW